jgi:hypothetical protein
VARPVDRLTENVPNGSLSPEPSGTLAIYSHVMPGDTESAMETVGDFMFGGRSATQN